MLIEFRVKNFRSIKDEQVFSLAATKDKELIDTNLLATNVKAVPQLLRSAVIYGPNASGKSNLINAFNYMRAVVIESSQLQPEQNFNVQNFRLSKSTENEPTEFELTFIVEGVRYQYGFTMTTERICDEWLLVYKASKPQTWFNRCYDAEKMQYVYQYSDHLTGPRKVWQDATRSNALFLSTAINLNSEQFRPIYNWITSNLILFAGGQVPHEFSTRMLRDDNGKEFIRSFLNSADISIDDISVETKKGFLHQFQFQIGTGKSDVTPLNETDFLIPKFHHKTEYGSATFGLEDESEGTRHLYALAAPVYDVLAQGLVLLVDELNSSLHPLLVRHLVSLFQNPDINSRGAQLIFSTHDTTLLDSGIFRRDQIWLINKNKEQASELLPLTDFSPRKGEALGKGYLIGRYGAIPFFDDWHLPKDSQ